MKHLFYAVFSNMIRYDIFIAVEAVLIVSKVTTSQPNRQSPRHPHAKSTELKATSALICLSKTPEPPTSQPSPARQSNQPNAPHFQACQGTAGGLSTGQWQSSSIRLRPSIQLSQFQPCGAFDFHTVRFNCGVDYLSGRSRLRGSCGDSLAPGLLPLRILSIRMLCRRRVGPTAA
jgi:hypothetical protein